MRKFCTNYFEVLLSAVLVLPSQLQKLPVCFYVNMHNEVGDFAKRKILVNLVGMKASRQMRVNMRSVVTYGRHIRVGAKCSDFETLVKHVKRSKLPIISREQKL